MKKAIALLLIIVISFSIIGCADAGNNMRKTDTSKQKTEESAVINDKKQETTQKTQCNHTWKSATCTAPKTCTKCNATEGNALGHSWVEATCQSPKKCKNCNITEGSLGSCKDNGSGRCVYCGKDLFLDKIKANLTMQLLVPSAGASDNYYFNIKIVNHTGSTIYLSRFASGNGKLCDNSQATDYALETGYSITVPYYRDSIAYFSGSNLNKYKDMYLDNSSLANTTIKLNGKTIHIKFGNSGITEVGYSLGDIGVY